MDCVGISQVISRKMQDVLCNCWYEAHLLDAVLSCSGMPILAEMADSREASKLNYNIF
jgi:hypothetical protein